MANTNMDLNKPSKIDGPQLEFTLPVDEVGGILNVGEKGKITIPCEVTQFKDGMVSFRKSGKAESTENWKPMSLDEERSTLPIKE